MKKLSWGKLNPERHRALIYARNKRHLEQGICMTCSSPRLPNSTQFCEKHWYAHLARSIFGAHGLGRGRVKGGNANIQRGALLKKILEDQDYRCPYTGDFLVPGVNASIDHKKPKCRHPELSTDVSNLQWVSVLVNRAKWDMEEEDFIGLCRRVVSYCDKQGR